MKQFKLILLPAITIILAIGCTTHPQTIEIDPTQWVATDDLGRKIDPDNYPSTKEDRQVGIFYFLWHGCHGYDITTNSNHVLAPTSADISSPYDNNLAYAQNPENPKFGAVAAMHHWAEPYYGYYLSNDEWVMRRHAQLLSNAGVDVIFFDVTNSYTYLPIVEQLCNVYTEIRKQGGATPQIAFLLNSNPKATLKKVYEEFYKPQRFAELWYRWEGKPLILVPENAATDEHRNFFTIRRSWFASHPETEGEWFGDGKGRWTWGDYYPQQAGWVESPDKPEQVSIMPATHPHMNVGRSHDGTRQPEKSEWKSEQGVYFSKQIERALEIDPKFVFITGWNEWTAQRQLFPPNTPFANSYQRDGGTTFFVDQFIPEFSRDIEPMRGGFGDNYYYQMVDFIRQYKGVNPIKSHSKRHSIKVDGQNSDWGKVSAAYADYVGDADKRDAAAWGRIGRYTNLTGRNDITLAKVASDKKKIYFMAECQEPIVKADKACMQLFISVGEGQNWQGFNYAVNREMGSLERCNGDWNWEKITDVEYAINNNTIEIAIPLSEIGIDDCNNFTLDFKWVDNACANGDIMECMDKGDSAPDARFAYRYSFAR